MQKKQRLKVGGDWYIAIDIGVDNLGRAEWNRQMVIEQRYIQGYLEVENWLEHHKATEPLPAEYVGHLPSKDTQRDASFVSGIEKTTEAIERLGG